MQGHVGTCNHVRTQECRGTGARRDTVMVATWDTQGHVAVAGCRGLAGTWGHSDTRGHVAKEGKAKTQGRSGTGEYGDTVAHRDR